MPTNAIQIIRDEHMAVAAMLHSLDKLVAMGPGSKPQRFFEVVRAMLFYVDEFPERRHHPNETKYLFPLVARGAPELQAVIDRLEADHASGEQRVRELQHLLTAWEMLGESRREAFAAALHTHVRFYLQHMRVEETELLPVADRLMSDSERRVLDAVFVEQRDPLAGGTKEPEYEQLFRLIVQKAPAPIGLGEV
jgi:hemerythrin-like domain-containing protein